ncbi:MAG: methyltransferase domain-containing protein [Zavarzinella sp.]
MLQRILEPEVMDTHEEAHGYDAMDHREVNERFVADFLALWDGGSPILDLGTGTAQIPIEFCRQSPLGKVIAVDASQQMLLLGQQNVNNAGFTQRIELVFQDAKQLSYPDQSFAAIMSNSIIHHIPNPDTVVREIARLIQPGGTILVRDLLRPTTLEERDALVSLYAGSATPHQQQMFAESLHAALTLAEIQEMVVQAGFPASGVSQTTDRHWTWAVAGTGTRT